MRSFDRPALSRRLTDRFGVPRFRECSELVPFTELDRAARVPHDDGEQAW